MEMLPNVVAAQDVTAALSNEHNPQQSTNPLITREAIAAFRLFCLFETEQLRVKREIHRKRVVFRTLGKACHRARKFPPWLDKRICTEYSSHCYSCNKSLRIIELMALSIRLTYHLIQYNRITLRE